MRSELAMSDTYSVDIAIRVVDFAVSGYVQSNTNLRTTEPKLIRNVIA